jgi:hypothetical protein
VNCLDNSSIQLLTHNSSLPYIETFNQHRCRTKLGKLSQQLLYANQALLLVTREIITNGNEIALNLLVRQVSRVGDVSGAGKHA